MYIGDKQLRRFKKRLQLAPHQVLRYEWGGEVLWQTTLGQAPPPTPCPRCLAPRCFEAQVIPALLYLLIYMYVHILYKYTRVCVHIYMCRCMYLCIYIHTRYVLIRPPIPYITSSRCKRLHKFRPTKFLLHKRTHPRAPPCNDLNNLFF